MYRQVFYDEADKRLVSFGGGITGLAGDIDVADREGDKLDDDVEGGKAAAGVKGGDVAGETGANGVGVEGVCGVVDVPERHVGGWLSGIG